MQQSITIQKNPSLADSSNYELLRKKGLEYIEQLGNALWTDYNIHDPGITILELLSYAITDLGYRTSLDIKDLLAPSPLEKNIPSLARQAFFPASEALTICPWNTDDYRKLLIDIVGVKNAWLQCSAVACDNMVLYANCANSKLQYENEAGTHPVTMKGFYDVMLEFDNEDGVGDLNTGKVRYNFSFPVDDVMDTAMLEVRLPSWYQVQQQPARYKDFTRLNNKIVAVNVGMISDGENATQQLEEVKLANRIRSTLYAASVFVEYERDSNPASEDNIEFKDIPFRVWFKSDNSRRQIKLEHIKKAMEDKTVSGIFAKYLALLQRAEEVMDVAKETLHNHRNLCEDFCSVLPVPVQDFAVCADMEVEPSADIEAVLAEVYYRIDQYLSPDIKFYSLKQLMDNAVPVDEIFEGPRLTCGFIKTEELASSNLKTVVYSSDIINLLMDVPGVVNIKNFILSKYDAKGNNIGNDEWVLPVSPGHQPRLYIEASKILVFKNGLPFLPDKTELSDTLQVINGKYAQPKYASIENDLPVPKGNYYELDDYYPLQYALPFTYGVGYAGLSESATPERKAQAKQLKAYLMFFEQVLVNYLQQLKNIQELFAVEDNSNTTYFSRLFDDNAIKGSSEIFNGLTEIVLKNMLETEEESLDRRNRFLDHLLSRFAESFSSYALMLYSFSSGRAVAQNKLIDDKVAFLKHVTDMGCNRAKGINYKKAIDYNDAANVQSTHNVAGLHIRIQKLLGMDGFGGLFEMYEVLDDNGSLLERRWRFKNEYGKIFLISIANYKDDTVAEAEKKARVEAFAVKQYIHITSRYQNGGSGFVINLTDDGNNIIATNKKTFSTIQESTEELVALLVFADKLRAADKVFVTEHLLLRPRYSSLFGLPPGVSSSDPLLTICIPPTCDFCEGENDPYSFRLTVVLSGESGIANSGMEFRRFAEDTIRKEVPAHLGVKVCWVSNTQLLLYEAKFTQWLSELSQEDINAPALHDALDALVTEFTALHTVYPEATLHDCIDGNDENRVLLGRTAIVDDKTLDDRIRNRTNT